MKSLHTPGIWRAEWLDEDNGWIMDQDGNYLAEIVTNDEEGKFVDSDQQTYNGILMAEAPNLLKMLEAAVARMKHSGLPFREKFEEAIAKAKGETK